MYTDTCEIINEAFDKQYGTSTPTTQPKVACRVELEDKVKNSTSGNTVTYSRCYILPPRTVVYQGDKIKTLTMRGETIVDAYVMVDKVLRIGAITPHHIEVLVV